MINNNLTVFYASSENQTAYSYDQERHGLFTYFLLKNLQETNGNVTLGDLSDYLRKNVNTTAANKLKRDQKTYTKSSLANWQTNRLFDPIPEAMQYKSIDIDVDNDIPNGFDVKANTYALIIGNEDYTTYQTDLQSESNVDYAINDAKTFREYLIKTMGVPAINTIILQNATLSQMKYGLNSLSTKVKALDGSAEVIFFYAGHGLPDDKREAYIMPVDISGSNVTSGIKLYDLYAELDQLGAKRVTVFLDACFSGGARNQGLVSLRGVRIRPRTTGITGNLVVFTSSSGDESSAPYRDKQHGLFTYFLLKKIKETKGKLTYKELSDYLFEIIPLESIRINSKEQSPQVLTSPTLTDIWENWSF